MVFRKLGFVMIYTVASEISLSVLTILLALIDIQYGENMEHLEYMILVIAGVSWTALVCWAIYTLIHWDE